MMTYDVTSVDLRPQPAAVVRGHVRLEEIGSFLGAAFGEVMGALAAQGLQPAGPPFARYYGSGPEFDVEAGFPATGAVAPTGRVVAETLPGGAAAQVLHRGAYSEVAAAYEAVTAWFGSHGYAPAGPPWESYLDEPGAPEPRTLVTFPYCGT